jgi:hypothetical protein
MPRALENYEIPSGISRSYNMRVMNNDIIFIDRGWRNFSPTFDFIQFFNYLTNRKLIMGCIEENDTVNPYYVYSRSYFSFLFQFIRKLTSIFDISQDLHNQSAGIVVVLCMITTGMKSAGKLLMGTNFSRSKVCCASDMV